MMSVLRMTVGAALLVMVSPGCKVGPNYQAPRVETPESFQPTGTQPEMNTTMTSPATTKSVIGRGQATWIEWWTKFDDDELNSLVARALAANHELAVARARVQEARAAERVTKSG